VTAVPTDDSTSLRPVGRYEWEAILRRAVLPKDVKYVGLVLATYADPDGTRVRPGAQELAAASEQSEPTVRRRVAELRALGLITQVSRGGGRGGAGKAAEYRLTLPADLLERIELRPPGGMKRALATVSPITQVSGQSDESQITQVSAQNHEQPVDNRVDNGESPLTVVSAQSPLGEPNDRSNDGVTELLSDQKSRLSAHPADQLPATRPNHPDRPTTPDPTQPPTARASPDPNSCPVCRQPHAFLDPCSPRSPT